MAKGKAKKQDKSRMGTDGRAHARLSASESGRWINCPGSVRAIDALPDHLKRRSSRAADEGTAAHALAELCIAKGIDARDMLGEEVGGFEVDDDMAAAVQDYLDFIEEIKAEFPDADFNIEKQFHLDWLDEDMFGTNDFSAAVIFDTLIVVDYKHGKGVPVEVEENTQLMYYAVGAAKEYEFNFDKVLLVIVQPRCPHSDGGIRKWAMSCADLERWAYDVLQPAARATRDPKAPLVAGPWCRKNFCPNAPMCPALIKDAFSAARAAFEDEPMELPIGVGHNGGPGGGFEDETDPTAGMTEGEFFAHALKWIPYLKHWIKQIEQGSYFSAEAGTVIPGKKLVEGKEGNRQWIKDHKKVVLSLKKAGVTADDMYTDPALKSPAQMEKISKEAKAAVAKLTERPAGKRQLADEDDPRPAIGPSLHTVFEAVDEDQID